MGAHAGRQHRRPARRDVILPVVPMFHANAWGLAHAAVAVGADLVMPGPDLSRARRSPTLIEDEQVTIAAGVPTIWMGVLPELDGRDTSSAADHPVRRLGGAEGAVRGATASRSGCPILQAWGMTETSPVASVGRIKSTLGRRRRRGAWPSCARTVGTDRARVELPGRRSRRPIEPLPWDGETTRRAPGARHRGSPARTTTTSGRPSRSPPTAGCETGDIATIDARRLHPARRPHQGPHQVRRRVDQLGRARERDHGPPEGGRGGRHRRPPPEVGRAAARVRRGRSPARTLTEDELLELPRRPGGEVVAARRRRVHRRGAEDQRRQVLEEGPARPLRRLRAADGVIRRPGGGGGSLGPVAQTSTHGSGPDTAEAPAWTVTRRSANGEIVASPPPPKRGEAAGGLELRVEAPVDPVAPVRASCVIAFVFLGLWQLSRYHGRGEDQPHARDAHGDRAGSSPEPDRRTSA